MARRKSYIKTGECIWCGKKRTEVSFSRRPHIVPDAVGGNEIGFDVCDECNEYFGKRPNNNIPSPDQVFSELFNLKRFSPDSNFVTDGSKFKSGMLYKVLDNGNLILSKKHLESTISCEQLKRAFYEIFLQKYHFETKDGNNPVFSPIVAFARYNKNVSDIKVYYLKEKLWLVPMNQNKTQLLFPNDSMELMNKTGFFSFYFLGYRFFLEIFKEKCNSCINSYFQSIIDKEPFFKKEISELLHISDIAEIFNFSGYSKIVIE